MTKVTFSDLKPVIQITAQGHTDTRVCAAVSFMLQALVQVLLDYNIKVYYILNDGNIDIQVNKHDMGAYSVECFYHLGFVRRALFMLAQQQPDALTFEYNKGGESK